MSDALRDRCPGRELDVARVGATPLRKRETSWKQPLAEVATRCEPLKSFAARLTQKGGDENALWLTVNEGPKCTQLDDMEFRFNARMPLDLPVGDNVSIKDGRNQMGQQGPSAWPTMTNTDNLHRLPH